MKITRMLPLALLVVVAGCDSEGRVRPPPTSVNMFQAAANFEILAFLREERPEATLNYGAGTAVSFDSGEYDFHLEYAPPGSLPVRASSISEDLSPDLNYSFVAVAPNDQPQLLVVPTAEHDEDASTAQLTFIHAHPDLGALDIYVEAPGMDLSAAAPRDNVSFGANAATFEVTPGSQSLYLTPTGDAATVLYETVELAIDTGTDTVIVVADPRERGSAEIDVYRLGSNPVRIDQVGLGAQLRVVQGLDERVERDVLLDEDTANPLFPAQPFGVISAYAPITNAVHELTLTPVGMPGSELASSEFTAQQGRDHAAFFAGNVSEGANGAILLEDKRRIAEQATLTLANVAGLFDTILVYVRTPGTDITTVDPTAELSAPGGSSRLPIVPRDYEITFQDEETQTILAGPVPVTMVAGGIYGILAVNNASGNTVDLEYFYDLAP